MFCAERHKSCTMIFGIHMVFGILVKHLKVLLVSNSSMVYSLAYLHFQSTVLGSVLGTVQLEVVDHCYVVDFMWVLFALFSSAISTYYIYTTQRNLLCIFD